MTKLNKTRPVFTGSEDEKERREVAKEELAAWNLYVDQREAELPEKYEISEQRAGSVKSIFKRLSDRKTNLLPSRKVLDLHHQFISAIRFDIKIDPENMA